MAGAVVAVSAAALFGSILIMAVITAALLVTAVFAAVKNNKLLFIIMAVCILVSGHTLFICTVTVKEAESIARSNVELSGVVCEPPNAGNRYVNYTVKVHKVEGNRLPVTFKIWLSDVHGMSAVQGDEVCLTASLSTVKGTAYRSSNYAEGIYLSGRVIKVMSVKPGKGVYGFAGRVKSYISDTLDSILPNEEATVLTALVAGDRSQMDDGLYRSVIFSGVSHMLVVSGMHLGIICTLLLKLFEKIFGNKRMAALLTLPSVLLIMIVCDFGYSILRAGLAYIIFLIGMILLNDSDPLSSLCWAVIILLILNPFALGSASFLLSVTSTFGIIVFSPIVTARIKERVCARRGFKWLPVITEPLTMTLSAMIFTLPVSMYFFGYVSTVALLTNMLLNYCITFSLCCTVLGLLLSCISWLLPAAVILLSLSSLCIKYFCIVVRFASSLAYCSIPTTRIYALAFTGMVAAAALLIMLHKQKRLTRRMFCALAAVWLVLLGAGTVYLNSCRVRITAVDVGNGMCVIVSRGGEAAVIGAGDDVSDGDRIEARLKTLGVSTVEAVYLTDSSAGRAGLTGITKNFKTEKVCVSQKMKRKRELRILAGDIFTLPKRETVLNGIKLTFTDAGGVQIDTGEYTVFTTPAYKPGVIDRRYAAASDLTVCRDEIANKLPGAKRYIINTGGYNPYEAPANAKVYETVAGDVTALIKGNYALLS